MAKVTQEQIDEAAKAPLKYFSHGAHEAETTSCRRFVRRCGPDGYGRYMRLLECLAAEEGHAIDIDDTESQYLLAAELWLGEDLKALGDLLKDLAGCGLIEMPGDGAIKAPLVDSAAQYFGRKRAAASAGGKKGRKSE